MATASFAGLIIVTVIVSAESLRQVWMGGSSCVSRWWIHFSESLLCALLCFSIALILVLSELLENTGVLGCDENWPTPKSRGCGNRPRQLSCKMRWLGEIYLTANTRARLQLRESLAFLSQLTMCPISTFIGLKAEVEGTDSFNSLSTLSAWHVAAFEPMRPGRLWVCDRWSQVCAAWFLSREKGKTLQSWAKTEKRKGTACQEESALCVRANWLPAPPCALPPPC